MPPEDRPTAANTGPRTLNPDSAAARAYNVGLGAKDHYEIDAAAFEVLLKVALQVPVAMRENRAPRGRRRVRPVRDEHRQEHGRSVDIATEVLSDEKAQVLAAQLQESWGGRWQVMWEPWGRRFRAFPAYDLAVNTPVEGRTLREVWRNVLNVDPKLLQEVAEAIPAHPPTVVHIPPGFFGEMPGE